MGSQHPEVGTARATWLAAAGLIAFGGSLVIVKGVVRLVTAADPSLVPWFGLGASLGLTIASRAMIASGGPTWAPVLAACFGVVGAMASVFAIGYLVTGTIPESAGAPAVVGLSYVGLTAGTFLALLVLASSIARRRSLGGRWRWVPLGVVAVQFPIFAVAEAVGDSLGQGTATDGLGMVLTGAAWVLLAYSLTRQPLVAPSAPASS